MSSSLVTRLLAVAGIAALSMPALVVAQEEAKGHPQPGQIHLQESVTPIMDSITSFHNGPLLWTITGIVVFVLILLVIVMVRFNARANPEPARFTHNTFIEIVWTVVPLLILGVLIVPSFGVLSDQMTVPDGERTYLGEDIIFGAVEVPAAALTIKATGQQWYWDYEYVEQGLSLSSLMLPDTSSNGTDRLALKPEQPRLLAVDNELVVPVDTTVRLQVTADPTGVIHALAVPSFGIKVDAVPGHLNETWFNARETGIYYGQCSELCGKDHAFMPIAVRVVTGEEFETFITAFEESRDYATAAATLPAVR